MSAIKIVNVRFQNYWKTYAFRTGLSLKVGSKYTIIADGIKYRTPVIIEGFAPCAPEGIIVKEITEAEPYEE